MSESKGFKAALAAPAEATDDDVDLEGFEYRVILHTGLVLNVISKLPADRLSSTWAKARKTDDIVAWNGDQFTEAKQIAHLESVVEEDGEEEDDDTSDAAKSAAEAGTKPAEETK